MIGKRGDIRAQQSGKHVKNAANSCQTVSTPHHQAVSRQIVPAKDAGNATREESEHRSFETVKSDHQLMPMTTAVIQRSGPVILGKSQA